MSKSDIKIERGSGNIFEDLGFPDPELHLLKAGLVFQIDQEIKRRNLTQLEASKIMGIRQPKLSTLLKGEFEHCTLDRLVRYLIRLDQHVEVIVRQRVS